MNFLLDLHENQNFTDVFVVCDGVTINFLHKVILSAYSTHFESTLVDLEESTSQLALEIDREATGELIFMQISTFVPFQLLFFLRFKGVSVGDLKIILDFMYTGRAACTPTLRQSAKTFGVTTLMSLDIKPGYLVESKDHSQKLLAKMAQYYKNDGKFTDVAVYCNVI